MSSPTCILVVDDEPEVLSLHAEILRGAGYAVWEADTGEKGLALAQKLRPDLVLLDVRMPGLSGLEVCARIKADPALADCFVVLVSGAAISIDDKISGLEQAADDYLLKPMEMREFLARIRTLIRLRDTTAALRQSEEHHRRLVEILPDAVGLIDLDGRLLEANRVTAVSLGYQHSAELVGKSLFELIRPEEHERLRANIALTLQTGATRGAEYTMTGLNGHAFPAELSAALLTPSTGRPRGLVVVARDITERKRAEEVLRRREELGRQTIESALDGFLRFDLEGRILESNETFGRMTGYAPKELLSLRLMDLEVGEPRPAEVVRHLERIVRAGSDRFETRYRTREGRILEVEVSAACFELDGPHLFAFVRDITERKRSERQKAAFASLGHRLGAATTSEEAARIILEIASDLMGWDEASLHLRSNTGEQLIPLMAMARREGRRLVILPDTAGVTPTPVQRWVMETGPQLLEPDQELPAAFASGPGGARPAGPQMCVPLRLAGAVVGVLSLESAARNAYTREDLKLLQTLADHCGEALHRIQTRAALQKAELKYRSIFENATEGLFQTTPGGVYLSANPMLARMLGYETADELMASISDIGSQMYVSAARRQEFQRALVADGAVREFEAELCRKDRSRVWVSLSARVVRDAQGTILFYQGSCQDITERKIAQQRLADALQLNETILATAVIGILAYRASGPCIFANQAAGRVLNAPVDQLLQQDFWTQSFWQDPVLSRMAKQTLRHRTLQAAETVSVTAPGRQAWFDCRMAAFVSGGEQHLLVMLEEITTRKRAEDELRQLPRRIFEAQEAERIRVARELHDGVNQILASAKMRLHNLGEKFLKLSPAGHEILVRCERLLAQALEENRRIARDLRPSDLDQLGLGDACRNLARQVQSESGLKVSCRILQSNDRFAPEVELHLFRIVQEALNNVVKHAGAKNVRLLLTVQKDQICVRIRDDGRGFVQRSARSQKDPNGGGNGLTNMRERAALLSGAFDVTSAPNAGTTITVRVPRQPAR